MTKRATVLAMLFVLAGCATSGPLGSDVITGSTRSGAARVVIYRDALLGWAIQPVYLIDGRSAGHSQINGFVVCDVPPGRHEIGVNNTSLNVNLEGGTDKVVLDLQPNTTTYFRAEPRFGLTIGVITLSNVTEIQGRADIASLHQIEGSCGAA